MARTGAHVTPPFGYEATAKALCAEAAIMLTVPAAVALAGQHTAVMTGYIAVLLFLRFALLYRRGDVVVFLAGVVCGGGNDVLSMWQGVYYYTPPTLLPVPIPGWMVVFWGEAFLFFRRLIRYRPFMAGGTPPRGLDLPLVLDLLLLIPLRQTVYRTAAIAWLPSTIYASVLLVRYLIAPPQTHERRLMLTILLLGPFYEALLIAAGLYVYQHGIVFGMPVWLIVYWLYIFRLLKALLDRFEARLAAVPKP